MLFPLSWGYAEIYVLYKPEDMSLNCYLLAVFTEESSLTCFCLLSIILSHLYAAVLGTLLCKTKQFTNKGGEDKDWLRGNTTRSWLFSPPLWKGWMHNEVRISPCFLVNPDKHSHLHLLFLCLLPTLYLIWYQLWLLLHVNVSFLRFLIFFIS